MSGHDDRPPVVPDCYGCIQFLWTRRWDAQLGRQIVVQECERGRVEVPHRCNEYQNEALK